MKDPARNRELLLFLFLGFISLFFLSLGADFPGHLQFRMGAGIFFIVLVLITRQNLSYGNPAFLLFAAFFIYLIFRALWAFCNLHILKQEEEAQFLVLMIRSPLQYFFYVSFFLLAYSFFIQKARVSLLMKWMSWNGFFLAVNAIPTFLEGGKFGYVSANEFRFFHPAFYFHPWIAQYLLAIFTHPNFLGDIMAFGFFPALGLAFYSFRSLTADNVDESVEAFRRRRRNTMALMFLQLVLALVIGAAILLLFSRGTITFFLLALFFFLCAYLLKFPSPSQIIFTFLVLILTGGFFIWGGNLEKAWKELRTLERETDPETRGSFGANVEGWSRALRIYKANPITGAGTGGYRIAARRFATPGVEDKHPLVNFQAMCHYVHLLAEEGAGAFLHYLFLLVYLIQVSWGLASTRSRFKFLMGLSLFAPVLLVLGHAAINDLMERFSTSMLVYITMGAGLAVLRKDFEH